MRASLGAFGVQGPTQQEIGTMARAFPGYDTKPLTRKEEAELRRLDRKILTPGKATRKELMRVMDLKRQASNHHRATS